MLHSSQVAGGRLGRRVACRRIHGSPAASIGRADVARRGVRVGMSEKTLRGERVSTRCLVHVRAEAVSQLMASPCTGVPAPVARRRAWGTGARQSRQGTRTPLSERSQIEREPRG